LFPRSEARARPERIALSWLVGAGVLGWMTHLALLLVGRAPAWIWALFSSVILIDAAIHFRSIFTPIVIAFGGMLRSGPDGSESPADPQAPPRIFGIRPGSSIAILSSLSTFIRRSLGRDDLWGMLAALPPLALLALQSTFLVISSLSYTQGWDGTIIW